MDSRRTSPRRTLLSTAAVLAFAAACAPDQVPVSPQLEDDLAPSASRGAQILQGAPQFVPGEVLVKFRAGVTNARRGAAIAAANASVVERIVTAAMRGRGDAEGLTLVRGAAGTDALIATLRGNADVEYAEPNWIYQHTSSNDTYYTNGSLWGMYSSTTIPTNQFGSGAAAAWARGTSCNNVWVGVIDEGYMFAHTDLAANVGTNPGETAGNGKDDDGNGLVDDVYGWDFANNDNTVFDGTSDDHGTHVAGTIGAVGNNGAGVVGVCQSGIRLMNAKFLGSRGGTTANAIKAVDYFTNLKLAQGINFVATNNSWGGGGFSQGLQDAIERANAAGILFVAAAGNSTLDCDTGSNCYPAEYPNANIIAVASIMSDGAISSFSNFGATTIDIGAPGSAIWSTIPASSRGRIVSSYASYSGTSMAAPHVAGAAALYAARNPGASAAQIKTAILSSATGTTSLTGKVLTHGRLNVSGF